jgi:hypothetical protein
MGSKERLSYSIAFKIEVVNYAEKHGNRAAERHFGSSPTEKMIRERRSENNHEDGFGGSDDDFLGFYDEGIILWLLILV